MKVLLDLDGVLVDFIGGACRLHGHPDPYTNPNNWAATAGVWHIESLLGLTEEQFTAPMTIEFWEKLCWTDDGVDILTMVESFVGPDNVYLVSRPYADGEAFAGKARWINANMPKYTKRFLLGWPKHVCASADTILIDDHTQNCKDFIDHGGRAILVPRAWNTKWDKAEHAFDVVKESLKQMIAPETITAEAERLVMGDRRGSYGHPREDYECTGAMWGAILRQWAKQSAASDEPLPVPARLAALMMVCVKLSRECRFPKRDNRVDGCGYLLCEDLIVANDSPDRQ